MNDSCPHISQPLSRCTLNACERADAPVIELSAVANPLGTPQEMVEALKAFAREADLASSPAWLEASRSHLADRFGMPPESFLCATTLKSMIRATARSFEPTAVAIASPSPSVYGVAVREAGCVPVGISNSVGFAAPDPDVAAFSGARFHAAVLANPGYPGSRLLARATLERYLDICRWVVVDESSIELTLGGETMIPLVTEHKNLIVVRSFAKAFALPGVPVGFIVAHPATIRLISEYGGVATQLSAMLCEEANRQLGFLENTRDVLEAEIPWLQCMLSLIPGISIYPAEANYVLCRFLPIPPFRCPVANVADIVDALSGEGFAMTSLAGMQGLPDDSFFSVSVRTRPENERFVSALRAVMTGDASR